MSLATAAYDRCRADATLIALVAVYDDSPAIIAADWGTLPEDVPRPFVVIRGTVNDDPADTKTNTGRDQTLTIGCYADARGDTAPIDTIAERLRTLFHRQPAGLVPGAYLAEVTGPTIAPTDGSLYGREIDVRVESLAP